MGKFASGKNAFAISDRSGFRYRYKDMRKEWNGLLVGKDEFESKQPQLGPFRTVSDPQALQDARPQTPDRTNTFQVVTTNGIVYLGNGNWSTSGKTQLPTLIETTPLLTTGLGAVTVATSGETGVSVNVSGVSGSSNVGTVTIVEAGIAVSGIAGSSAVGTVSVIAGSAPRFDSTSVTLDSTTDTFDEG